MNMVFIKPQTNNAIVLSIIKRSNLHDTYIAYGRLSIYYDQLFMDEITLRFSFMIFDQQTTYVA